jgi:hypothetical protein
MGQSLRVPRLIECSGERRKSGSNDLKTQQPLNLSTLLPPLSSVSNFSLFLSLFLFLLHHQEQDNFYLARPPCWRLDKRRLFNYRRIVFSPQSLPPELLSFVSHPLALAESLLKMALKLSTMVSEQILGSFSAEDVALWVSFLDQLSVLQILNISVLPERERAVFFLNLHHVMVRER